MKKLRLEVESLEVESFHSEEVESERGTVIAHWSFVDTTCGNTVWEAGCGTETAPLDCRPTEGGYTWCNSVYQCEM